MSEINLKVEIMLLVKKYRVKAVREALIYALRKEGLHDAAKKNT